jgi:hypothetical protein
MISTSTNIYYYLSIGDVSNLENIRFYSLLILPNHTWQTQPVIIT